MSFALEQLTSHTLNLKFGDLLQALRELGLDEKADRYESEVVVEAFLREIDSPLELTVKDIILLYESAPDPALTVGWDHAYRGKAYYGRGSR